MANRWTRRDYNRGQGEGEDIRREQRHMERGQQYLEDQYGRNWEDNDRFQQSQDSYAPFGTTRGPNYGSSYDRNYGENYGGEGEFYGRSRYERRPQSRDVTGPMSDRDFDEGYRDAARFERESHYGMERDQHWQPHRGRSHRHDRDHDHDRGYRERHEARDYREEMDLENDRGAWNRSRDEVKSWFGDENAKRRRHMDEAREDMRDRERDHDREIERRTQRYYRDQD